jgi:hypothetical protein
VIPRVRCFKVPGQRRSAEHLTTAGAFESSIHFDQFTGRTGRYVLESTGHRPLATGH